jgi:membrane-bound ClpP family serine protease
MNYYLLVYGIYLPVTVLLTVWVARTLFNNGRTFLVDIFHGNEALADSVNKLLLTGFYLINIGYATLTLRSTDEIGSYQQSVEELSIKIGTIILILGGMHFFNLYVFYKLRSRAQDYTNALNFVVDKPGK